MYICLCNALNERKVEDALSAGASSVSRVYKHHGCVPKCGKCIPLLRERVQERVSTMVCDLLEMQPAAA